MVYRINASERCHAHTAHRCVVREDLPLLLYTRQGYKVALVVMACVGARQPECYKRQAR